MRRWLARRWGVPQVIVVHHSAGVQGFLGENEWHRQRGFPKSQRGYYLGYHYFIERSGKVYQARNDWEIGAHIKWQNTGKIGICLQGQGHLYDFTPKQYHSLALLLSIKRFVYRIPVAGHRDFAPTVCPSDLLYKWIYQKEQMNS